MTYMSVDSILEVVSSIIDQKDELYDNHGSEFLEYCFAYIQPIWTSGTIARWLFRLVQKLIFVLLA